GTTLLADVEDNGLDSVVLMSGDGDSQPILLTTGHAQITFLNRSHDSIIVDQGTGDVYLLRDPAVSAELIPLAGIKETIGKPIATGLSYENEFAFFASGGVIAKVELATGSIVVTNCACTPDVLIPLNRNLMFRLSSSANGPIWIYDATQADPWTFVLP